MLDKLGILVYGIKWKFKICSFPFSNLGYCIGLNGKTFKTTNSIIEWMQITSPSNENLNYVYFIDANEGMILDSLGRIYKTSNGGINWNNNCSISSFHMN